MLTNFKRKSDHEETNNKRIKTDEDVEAKISKITNAVLAQGFLGHLVIILQNESESPYVTLQNSVSYSNIILEVTRSDSEKENFELRLNGQAFVKGNFQNVQLAKKQLAEEALEKLKEMCFFISKKNYSVNVTKTNLKDDTAASTTTKTLAHTNSIAHKIMMKMGWTGGGLGSQEQGTVDAVMVQENVNREGLGSNNLMREIHKKLENFSKSSNLLTLVFDASFTKEERAQIHKAARKYNLKSKSVGTESRKLTVSRKITRMDIVRELLRIGGEDGLYKLHIPSKFTHMW